MATGDADAKVVSIRGGEVKSPYESSPSVVAELERALEMARSGEIIGITAAYNHADDCTTGTMKGDHGRGTIGMLQILIADIVDEERADR